MNPIEEEEEDDDRDISVMTVDQSPSVRPPPEYSNHHSSNNNICSSKQTSDETDRTKYQTTSRSTSLPSRQSVLSGTNINENVKQHRRRVVSDSHTNNNTTITSSLVNSFLQYLRTELKTATTHGKNNDHQQLTKQKSYESISQLSQTLNLSNNFNRQQYPIKMSSSASSLPSSSSSSSSQSINLTSTSSNESSIATNPFDDNNNTHDDNEILTLVNLLILRVECLANKNTLIHKKHRKKHKNRLNNQKTYPSIKQVDQNLIEYLYYLFNKFVTDESDSTPSMIDKANFVNVCQTLVRNGCFNTSSSSSTVSASPDQSLSESTITNSISSEQTLTQTFVREYRPEIDDMTSEKLSTNQQLASLPSDEQDTWLVVDLESTHSQYSATSLDESVCLLQSSTSDDQLLIANENCYSFEELFKSCGSESSHSNYYSPNSSLVDLQNMVPDFDDINNNNNTLFNEDGSSSIDHGSNSTNVITEVKDTTSNNNICQGLTNEQVTLSSMDTIEQQMTVTNNDKMSRRERKMQERWTITTKNEGNNTEQLPTKTFLGVEFPPIAVLRRKFSTSPPTTSSPLPIKKKDSSSIKTKTLLNKNEIYHPLHDNIDKLTDQISSTTLNHSTPFEHQEINTLIPTTIVNQVDELQLNDASSSINCHDDVQQPPSEYLTVATNINKDMTKQETVLLSTECEKEKINTEINQEQQTDPNTMVINDLFTSNLLSSSLLLSSTSPPPLPTSSFSSSLTANTNENKTIEPLPKEIEKEKKEEEYCDDGDVEKKNDCSVEHNYHASGIILINVEPNEAAVSLEQEKKEKADEQEKERPTTLLPTREQCNQQLLEDESLVQILTNNLETVTMANVDENEQRYAKVEIEEISDDEDILSAQNNQIIEPTDYIHTDDEPKIPRQSNITISTDLPVELDTVLSCYGKALAKAVDTIDGSVKPSNVSPIEPKLVSPSSSTPTTKSSPRPEDDPIALRALQRFEQRMNAAVTAKTDKDEGNLLASKGKSSWSGTLASPRKSLENIFKNNQQLQSTPISTGDETITVPLSSPQRDSFIRPRKTVLDDHGPNFGMTMNVFGAALTNTDNHKPEEQHQPTAIIENDANRVVSGESTNMIDLEDHQQQQEQSTMINSSMTSESGIGNEVENSSSLAAPSLDSSSTNSSLNTVVSYSSSSEQQQQSLAPYRLQLEGRRRLNTLDRFRECRQNYDATDAIQQQQLQSEYTPKADESQDPIIRRALERFDEKSRSLIQTKSMNYDEIQDPITRRALMRLDTNLRRTISSNPPPITNNNPDETWFTNSYTLGSLQSHNDNRFVRYPDSSLPPTPNNKTSHISVQQRFASTPSAEMPYSSVISAAGDIISNNEYHIPIMRVPSQPIYVTSNNQQQQQQQQQQQPINLRQRSRSEDMLSSKDLSIGQTTNLDDNETSQLQRNHSSDELQTQPQPQTSSTGEVALNEPDFQLPNTILKSLDPNFVRTAEASVNYVTPTKSYSAYSCEYIRPHRNQSLTSPESDLPSPRTLQQPQQEQQQQQQPLPPTAVEQQNEIEYSTPSSSAFAPVHPSTNTYHPQQPLPTPSYTPMYTSNSLNQTPYSDDPIVRRALERFNCQMQNSLMSMPQQQQQQQQNMNYMSRQYFNGYPRQGNFDPSYPNEPNQYDTWANPPRSLPPTSNGSSGYQSIIGRRRQLRQDDVYLDNTSVGNGYSSSLFVNSPNPYPMTNHYMNFADEPPAIPPRFHRDIYHEQPEYLSENVNNNNNNNNPNAYIHHAYPATTNGFRPINLQYIPTDCYNQFQEEEYLRHRAQSTSSTTSSSDSFNTVRLNPQRLPPTFARTNIPQNSQLPTGQTTPSNGNVASDSVFHRLAYTNTKASLSKSSSNLCANLLNKNPQQQNQSNNILKSHEIDLQDSTNLSTIENNQEITSTATNTTNKCQRSRSVDGRARLKNAQARTNRPTNDYEENNNATTVPSSKFTPVNTRREAPPPRLPVTPRSTFPDRTPLTKRTPSGNNLSYARNGNGIRARGSSGNLLDADNHHHHQQDTDTDENLTLSDNYQPKIMDNRTRTSIPVHRYTTNNNNIQPSPSTSSVVSTVSRTKVPIPTNLDRRDSNSSSADLSRLSKRSDDNRVLSPSGQRRNIPVSVFAPAKIDNKRPAPAPPAPSSTSPTNDDPSTLNQESQQVQPSLSSPGDSSYTTIDNENEMNNKLSSTNLTRKSSTGNILNELSLSTDKHDNNKKMNVFERLFRGNKKKV